MQGERGIRNVVARLDRINGLPAHAGQLRELRSGNPALLANAVELGLCFHVLPVYIDCLIYKTLYQRSFSPNWICRDGVEVLVIKPAVGETPAGVKVIAFGVLKLALFKRFKNSARN